MATKRLDGTLSITGKYAIDYVHLITSADYAYDPTKTYEAGQLCYYGTGSAQYGTGDGRYLRCLEDGTTGTFDWDKWEGHPDYGTQQDRALFYQVEQSAQLVIDLTGATISNDTTNHKITIVKSGHLFPLDGTAADNRLFALLKGDAVRSILWSSGSIYGGLLAQVQFGDYFLNLSQVESEDLISLQCYSPACKMTIVDETGSDGNTTIILHFTNDASSVDGIYSIQSPYEVISYLISMGQYDTILLRPVLSYNAHYIPSGE